MRFIFVMWVNNDFHCFFYSFFGTSKLPVSHLKKKNEQNKKQKKNISPRYSIFIYLLEFFFSFVCRKPTFIQVICQFWKISIQYDFKKSDIMSKRSPFFFTDIWPD